MFFTFSFLLFHFVFVLHFLNFVFHTVSFLVFRLVFLLHFLNFVFHFSDFTFSLKKKAKGFTRANIATTNPHSAGSTAPSTILLLQQSMMVYPIGFGFGFGFRMTTKNREIKSENETLVIEKRN